MKHKIGEYDFSDARRDLAREQRFRLRALEALPSDAGQLARLRDEPRAAAELLRLALQDAAVEPRAVEWAARAVSLARGGIAGLGLTLKERAQLGEVLALALTQERATAKPTRKPRAGRAASVNYK